MTRAKPLAAAVLASLLLAGCDGNRPPLGPRPDAGVADPTWTGTLPVAGDGQASVEQFQLCKVGSSATFSYSVTDRTTGASTTSTITLQDGACQVIAASGGLGQTVTVTETAAQSGFQLSYVDVTTVIGNPPVATTRVETGPTVTDTIGGTYLGDSGNLRGALARFFNEPIPSGGGEGCTPGFWKQSSHFALWPAPYTPSTLFSSVFDDAFPGKTLLQVLKLSGGSLNNLGRHTVAALLNAASASVSYDLTTQQVIDQFNAVFPGGNYNGLKNTLAQFNEQGCPLS